MVLAVLFLVSLFVSVAMLLYKSFESGTSLTLQHYRDLILNDKFVNAFGNSFTVSGISALVVTLLTFLMACIINYTNVSQRLKKGICNIATLPMLLPTITYGFAIIYTSGRQGLLNKLLHVQPFGIYGFNGLLVGYVIYTLSIAFLLVNNTTKFIDKKFTIVLKIMGDFGGKRFWMTALSPMIPTLAAAFLQAFFLSFTDFGIPVAVGDEFVVVATTLYSEMLGSIPNFSNGAVIAMMMLPPFIISIVLLNYPERYNVRYNKINSIEPPENKGRDLRCGLGFSLVLCGIALVFAVITLLPLVKEWPYDISFSPQHFTDTLASANLLSVYYNSLIVALGTAAAGTLVAYGSALVTTRSTLPVLYRKSTDAISSIASTIPGMITGIAFLLVFSGTPLQSTFWIIILCNTIYFFPTPYVMAKNALGKLNTSYETTAMLMGDSWFKTIRGVVVPDSKSTILGIFSYYFINSMVMISALIFIAGARAAVLTTKIKELQHFAKFDQIFVLPLLVLLTDLLVKGVILSVTQKKEEKKVRSAHVKKYALGIFAGGVVLLTSVFGQGKEPIVIYSNADEEVLVAIRYALDENGSQDQYILQSFGTSELGGKIMAEGENLEADVITMNSHYIDSAQQKNNMFDKLTFPTPTLKTYSDHDTPLTALEGTMIVNMSALKEKQLPVPSPLKEPTNPKYKGMISIPGIKASSTGWLLVQALLDTYGEEEEKGILTAILDNVDPHLESNGSGPLKKVRSGEAGTAFGLRRQTLVDKGKGLPIDCIDPIEGNYSLTESIAVVKRENVNKTAMTMARCIMENGGRDILHTYSTALYEGEQVEKEHASKYPRVFKGALGVELLEEHQALFGGCRK